MLTQDDCKQAAFSCTWASINGKPLSNEYYYDINQLNAGDLPPDYHNLGKTLGSSDCAGNEVRFAFTTTISPELKYMDDKSDIQCGNKLNNYRFYMREGLSWCNVIEMLNYGNSVAFHDVNTNDVNNVDSIIKHYDLSQKIILNRLSGRGCKTLAEPNGNKSYVTAAQSYTPIQTITAQAGTITLYPFKVNSDLQKLLLNRVFYNSPQEIKGVIASELQLRKEERAAVHVGVHGTDNTWTSFLLWLNDTYGKDGDNSVWFPSMEEYYEYNYYRTHGSVTKSVFNNTLKLTISLPSNQYFYYPSITLNLKNLKKENLVSVSSTDLVTGLSYGNYEGGMTLNIDCRQFLVLHATHFVEKYEKNKTDSNFKDAKYFIGMLKDSDKKSNLLNRVK